MESKNVTATGDEAMIIAWVLGMMARSRHDEPLTQDQASVKERCAELSDRFRKLSHELKAAAGTTIDHGFASQ